MLIADLANLRLSKRFHQHIFELTQAKGTQVGQGRTGGSGGSMGGPFVRLMVAVLPREL